MRALVATAADLAREGRSDAARAAEPAPRGPLPRTPAGPCPRARSPSCASCRPVGARCYGRNWMESAKPGPPASERGRDVKFGADQVAPFFGLLAPHAGSRNADPAGAVVRGVGRDISERCGSAVRISAKSRSPPAVASWQSEFEMTWASALDRAQTDRANMLLYWAFMERAADEGLTRSTLAGARRTAARTDSSGSGARTTSSSGGTDCPARTRAPRRRHRRTIPHSLGASPVETITGAPGHRAGTRDREVHPMSAR